MSARIEDVLAERMWAIEKALQPGSLAYADRYEDEPASVRDLMVGIAKGLIEAGFGDVAQARKDALLEAVDQMEAVIANGDVAEVAAPVEGEVGRQSAVDNRDALYNDPVTWLRSYAGDTEGLVLTAGRLLEEVCGYEPCHGANEDHERHARYCVPFYDWRDDLIERAVERAEDPPAPASTGDGGARPEAGGEASSPDVDMVDCEECGDPLPEVLNECKHDKVLCGECWPGLCHGCQADSVELCGDATKAGDV